MLLHQDMPTMAVLRRQSESSLVVHKLWTCVCVCVCGCVCVCVCVCCELGLCVLCMKCVCEMCE